MNRFMLKVSRGTLTLLEKAVLNISDEADETNVASD